MNPFYQAMGGNRQPNMMQQFQQFMNQMKGKDPNAMIQEMVSSGRISQDQLNQVQKQAQQMQEEMGKLQEELDVREYTVTAGGGAVTAVVDGKHIVKKLEIKPEVVDPEDVDMLADLVMAAVNEAIRQAVDTSEAEMSKITGGINMPGLF